MKRAEQKDRTHRRIVDIAARRFREEGLFGAGVQQIMNEAGLTHGGFYTHFDSKADLIAQALVRAGAAKREIWSVGIEEPPGPERTRHLVARYLSAAHRDSPGKGCPLPSLCADITRAPASVRRAFDQELRNTVDMVEADLGRDGDRSHALGTLALCVGGLLLARAAEDSDLSEEILQACRIFADAEGSQIPSASRRRKKS